MGLRLEDAGFGKLGFPLFLALLIIPLLAYGFMMCAFVARAAGGGVEFNAVTVWVPQNDYGQLGVFNIPLNVSSTNLLSYENVYVIDGAGKPYYSYLFSANPPVVSVIDPSMSTKTYSVFYGGTNPYSSYVAVPGQSPIYAAFDDFDYDSGMWNYTGEHTISQSQLLLKNGSAIFNTSYTPNVVAMWKLRSASTAYAIELLSPVNYTGWVQVHLTASNFGDWSSIINGWDDVFFTDSNGHPLNYSIAYVNLAEKQLDAYVYVNLTAGKPKTIMMFYGRSNPYADYRQPISAVLRQEAINEAIVTYSPPPQSPISAYKITYSPPPQSYITLNTTINASNVLITPGTIIAPHLINAIMYGDDGGYFLSGILYMSEAYKSLDIRGPVTLEAYVRTAISELYNIYSFINFEHDYTLWQTSTASGIGWFGIADTLGNGVDSFDLNLGNAMHYIAGVVNVTAGGELIPNKTAFLYYDGKLVTHTAGGTTWSSSGLGNTLAIGTGGVELGYVAVYASALTGAEVNATQLNHVINASSEQLRLLVDPTFLVGSRLVNLINESMSVDIEGRVVVDESAVKWLYVVYNAPIVKDDYVHLRFFPYGATVTFSQNGSVVAWVKVGGIPNKVGLVDDYAIRLPAGTYNVTVSIRGWRLAKKLSPSSVAGLIDGGLYLYRGPVEPGASTTIKTTEGGGDIYWEYVNASAGIAYAWYTPGYSLPTGTDYYASAYQLNAGMWFATTYVGFGNTALAQARVMPWRTVTETVTISDYLTLTTPAVFIAGNTSVAPHLYMWWFNGHNGVVTADAYAKAEVNNWTFLTGARMESDFKDCNGIFGTRWLEDTFDVKFRYGVGLHGDVGSGSAWIDTNVNYLPGGFVDNRTYDIAYVVTGSGASIWLGGVRKATISYSGTPLLIKSTGKFMIGQDYRGTAGYSSEWGNIMDSYVLIYSGNETRLINATMEDHVINATKMIFFLDPTFYNGSQYMNLANLTANGIPHGGAYRVPDPSKWLWVLVNSTTDNYVHLMYFPNNTIVKFINPSTGNVVKEVTVTGKENAAGLVPDFKTTLAPGEYVIEAEIPQKTVIAPHLYQWKFSGSQYLVVNYTSTVASYLKTQMGYVEAMFQPAGSSSSNLMDVLMSGQSGWAVGWLQPALNTTRVYVRYTNGTYDVWTYRVQTAFTPVVGRHEVFGIVFNNTRFNNLINWTFPSSTWANGNSYLSGHIWVDYDNYPIYVGREEAGYYYSGNVSYVLMSRFYVNTSTHVFDGEYMMLLADPTFYNGTYYFGLLNASQLIKPVGVGRVPAPKPWVWVVRAGPASDDDGLVDLRWFPAGTVVFIFKDGVLYRRFIITGATNGMGLVKDYVIQLPSGTYTFKFFIAKDGVSILEDDAVSYQYTNDGYALKVTASMSQHATGPGVVGVPLTELLLGEKQYPEVWANNTFITHTTQAFKGSAWNNATVIEMRIRRPAGVAWGLYIDEVASGAVRYSDWSHVFAGVYVAPNNSVYFIYGPDGVNESTGITVNSTIDWVAIKFTAPNRITVYVGDGNYSTGAIYFRYARFTYTATHYGPTHVMWFPCMILRPGQEATFYLDWMRIRPAITGMFNITPTHLYGVYVKRYNAGDVNREDNILSVRIDNAYAVGIGIEGAGGGVGDVFIGAKTFFTGAEHLLASLTQNGTVVIANGTDVVAESRSPQPLTGWIYVVRNGTELTVWYVGAGVRERLASVTSSTPTTTYVDLWYVNTTSSSASLAYAFNRTAMVGATGNMYPTISAFNPSGTAYSVGWVYNFTVSNTSAYVDVDVAFTPSAVVLRIRTSWGGVVKEAVLGRPRSPAVVMVGYGFSSVTSSVEAFAEYVWMDGNVTRCATAYMSAYVNTTVPYMYPYINATRSFVIVDKFAVTLGNVLESLAKGVFTMTVRGPMPVGGMVKYTTFNQPTIIKWTGSDVEFIPQAEGSGIILQGFKGWTLNLAVSGTSASGLTITSDSYPVDVHLGFTAMIIVDPSSREVSIIAASPPPQEVTATVTTGMRVAYGISAPPPSGWISLSINDAIRTLLNPMLLAGAFAGVAIVAYRMTGEVGLAIAIPSATALFIFAVMQQWDYVMVAVVALVAGLAIRVAR